MASNPNENNEDPKSKAAVEEDGQLTAYLEKYMTQLSCDNDTRATLIAENYKALDVLIAEKYTILNNLAHVENAQTFVADLEFLHSKNTSVLECLNQLVCAKRNVFLAYEVHCKKALKVKADMQKKKKCFDEFTGMNYHELKKAILSTAKEEEEIRAKTALKSEELKKKLEILNVTQKSMSNDIRVLNQIERDAMEIIEDLKSRISAMQVHQKANNI